jgi:outer membrane receptor for monomeric catechols
MINDREVKTTQEMLSVPVSNDSDDKTPITQSRRLSRIKQDIDYSTYNKTGKKQLAQKDKVMTRGNIWVNPKNHKHSKKKKIHIQIKDI